MNELHDAFAGWTIGCRPGSTEHVDALAPPARSASPEERQRQIPGLRRTSEWAAWVGQGRREETSSRQAAKTTTPPGGFHSRTIETPHTAIRLRASTT